MTRLAVVGHSSFIAEHILREARAQEMVAVGFGHGDDFEPALTGFDTVINCAIDPAMFTTAYAPEMDWDLRVARAARAAGARFAMCSTRRVYSDATRLGVAETSPAEGDETVYGRNKAASERAVLAQVRERGLIFRLSNIFGFEHAGGARRTNFFGQMLASLHGSGEIRFDMSPRTRRDFLPVEVAARAVVLALQSRMSGIYNLGCGFPVSCGDVAEWLIEGYGGGRLVATDETIRDEFFLDMSKWNSTHPPLTDEPRLRQSCVSLGRRLRDA